MNSVTRVRSSIAANEGINGTRINGTKTGRKDVPSTVPQVQDQVSKEPNVTTFHGDYKKLS